jgi:hopanoid biosynthesis associated protein HpnK
MPPTLSSRAHLESGGRRLVVNGDDFGLSSSINAAVIQAHRDGILTSASLMVNEPAADEAVALARQHPGLGVGLHLALLCGHSALDADLIPGLVNDRREFSDHPVRVGLRYFARRSLREPLRREIAEQFERFRATGLTLDHVNGHLHLHLHPTVFALLMENAARWGITHVRLTRDHFWFNAHLARGQWLYRGAHAVIFHLLSRRARPALRRRAIKHTSVVFGLLQHARVDETYVTRLLSALPPGDSELYSHPSQFRHELDALVSPRVRALARERHIQLIRYQDL